MCLENCQEPTEVYTRAWKVFDEQSDGIRSIIRCSKEPYCLETWLKSDEHGFEAFISKIQAELFAEMLIKFTEDKIFKISFLRQRGFKLGKIVVKEILVEDVIEEGYQRITQELIDLLGSNNEENNIEINAIRFNKMKIVQENKQKIHNKVFAISEDMLEKAINTI